MSIATLPTELLAQVVDLLIDQQDINSVTRLNRRFYKLFNEYLYTYNIRFRKSRALLWAAKHGQETTARRLLHLGADVNTKLASTGGSLAARRVLRTDLIPGFAPIITSPMHGNEQTTALHFAAIYGHYYLTTLLLKNGADVDARMTLGRTPFHKAIQNRHESVCRLLLDNIPHLQNYCVDPSTRLTPLHLASQRGSTSIVRYCLDKGVNIEARDSTGRTALHTALDSNKHHFNEYSRVSLRNMNVSHETEIRSCFQPPGIFETVKVLLEYGADTNAKDQHGISVRTLGKHNQDSRVRGLFEDHQPSDHQQNSVNDSINRLAPLSV